jgi:hypothetical protein
MRIAHLCFPCARQQAGSMASELSVALKASCANGRRRLTISSKALSRPFLPRWYFCMPVRNALTPSWKRLYAGSHVITRP